MKIELQKLLQWVVLCTAIMVILVSWVAPSTIAWYFATPVPVGVDCRPATEWAMQRLRYAQAIASGIGVVVGVLLWAWRFKKLRDLRHDTIGVS